MTHLGPQEQMEFLTPQIPNPKKYHLFKNKSINNIFRNNENGLKNFKSDPSLVMPLPSARGPVPVIQVQTFGTNLSQPPSSRHHSDSKWHFPFLRRHTAPIQTTASVPLIVSTCITNLSQDLTIHGLFRESGNKLQVAKLRAAWESGGNQYDMSLLLADESPHNVASLLVHYFCQLPEPLIPTKYYSCILRAAQEINRALPNISKLKKTFEKFPSEHKVVLQPLFGFLASVAQNADKNKMNEKNLGIVFGPILLRPPPEIENNLTVEMLNLQAYVIELLITYHQEIITN